MVWPVWPEVLDFMLLRSWILYLRIINDYLQMMSGLSFCPHLIIFQCLILSHILFACNTSRNSPYIYSSYWIKHKTIFHCIFLCYFDWCNEVMAECSGVIITKMNKSYKCTEMFWYHFNVLFMYYSMYYVQCIYLSIKL